MALERCGRPGIALTDGEILSGIFLRLRKMYAEQGGANPDPGAEHDTELRHSA